MPTDLIRYDLLVQEALKGVVRRILIDAARDGLPGEHHFYISFNTNLSGVRLSPRLRERYPQDMTIVLQHQFDNLTINDQAFEVGLSFSGVAERLRVPFDAVTGFFDPSVQFGLKFETCEDAEANEAPEASAPIPLAPPKSDTTPTPIKRGKGSGRKLEPVPEQPEAGGKAEDKPKTETENPDQPASAEVVSLDSFRKKN